MSTVLAFDFGTRSIGVAVGNDITKSARPLSAIKAIDGIPNEQMLDKVIKEWQPGYIVVGLPLNMDGTDEEVGFKAKKFGNRLAAKYKLKVCFKDERLTTVAAKEEIFANQGYRGLQKSMVDCVSAALILEAYFAENS